MRLSKAIFLTTLGFSAFGCSKGELPKTTTPSETSAKDVSADSKEDEQRKVQEAEKQKQLVDAIQVYRNSKEKEEAGEKPAYQQAWKTIVEAGADGVLELKKELKKVAFLKDGDVPFETAASLLLFEIGGLEEAEAIAEIWNRIPHTVNYNGMFSTALKAAKTKDPRAIPMLKACLGSQKGSVVIIVSGMRLFWPTTHEVLWGVYGPKGLNVLFNTLKETQNTVAQKSAIRILATAGYIDALDEVRKFAKLSAGAVRLEAIRALGTYGHPDDFDTLVAGLSSNREDEIVTSVFALLNFEDLRATESILPLADSLNERIKTAALSTISYLLTPDSLTALHKCSTKEKNKDIRAQCKKSLDSSLQRMGVSYKKFASKSSDAKEKLVSKVHELEAEAYTMKPGDQKLTREQFLQTIKEWKENKSIQQSTLDWVGSRHILDIATPEDIEEFIDLRSSIQTMLTQEGFRDVSLVNEMIKHLSRRRYRTQTGIFMSVQ